MRIVSKRFARTWFIPMLLSLVASTFGCRQTIPTQTKLEEEIPAPEHSASSATFVDRSVAALANCGFSNGKEAGMNSILEIVGGGVGCIDYDLDGNIDLFFPLGGGIDAAAKNVYGKHSKLMQGDGAWQFSDRSQAARIDTSRIYSHGITAADYDQDGFEDLLIYGYEGVVLLRNLGDGTFRDATTAAGLGNVAWTTAAAWLDVDCNGSLDLYLGSYVDWNFGTHQVCPTKSGQPDVCSPNVFEGMSNSLYIGNASGEFTQASQRMDPGQPAKTLGVLAAEFQPGEGVDLYVANDLLANFMFSRVAGGYEERAFAAGVAADDRGVVNGSMGLALFDFNLDRQFDIFVTNFEHELMALYLNSGGKNFHHSSRQAGLNRSDLQIVGFGVVADDFDGDGDEDVVFTGGHVHYFPDHGSMSQLPVYLENEAGKKFVKLAPSCDFFTKPTVGRGLATADLDHDGDLDLIQTSLFALPAVIENTSPHSGQWLTVELIGTGSPRTPIGTTVELNAGETRLVRQLSSGGSYLSQSQQVLHFAWANESPPIDTVALRIRWPDGSTQDKTSVAPGQHIMVIQQSPASK